MPLSGADKFNAGITLLLATNVGKFKKEMSAAGESVEGFGASAVNAVQRVNHAATAIRAASLAAGAAMVGVAAVAVRQAMELETAINNVATVWDVAGQQAAGTFKDLGSVSEELIDMSTRMPQSAAQLAEALYDVASSGFQGSEAMTVMEASAKAASAGLTTTEVAARGITTVLNAYDMEAEEATHVSDVLFQTVNVGVVTFEELASVMGDFVGMAATAGVSIEEASAALATMTLSGISAAESSTSLNRVMQEFIEPGEVLSSLLRSMGYESGVLALQQEGLHGILTRMAQTVGYENVEAWAALFPEIRAVRGVLALVAGEASNYTDVVGKLTDEQALYGATQDALDKQSQSLSYQLTILANTIKAITLEFGQQLLPVVKLVGGVLQDFIHGIQAMPDWLKELAGWLGVITGSLIVLGGLWVSNKITSILFSRALAGVTAMANAANISVAGLTRALHLMKVAMGVIGIALAAVTVAVTLFGKSQEDTDAQATGLKETLDAQTGAITANTGAWVRDQAVKEGWLKTANLAGVANADLTAALLGDEDAIARVNAKLDEHQAALDAAADEAMRLYRESPDDSSSDYYAIQAGTAKDFKDQAKGLRQAIEDTNGEIRTQGEEVAKTAESTAVAKNAMGALETAEQKEAKAALANAEAHIKAIDAINKEVNSVIDLASAYKAAQEKADEAAKTEDDSRARTKRHRAEQDALDDELAMEEDAFEKSAEQRQKALDDRQEDERQAWEDSNRDAERALDERRRIEDRAIDDEEKARSEQMRARHKAEEDALDLVLRTQKNAFDDQLRLQKDAFDDRMEELRDQNDELIEEENDAWEIRKHQLENMIEDTFGEERQRWQQVLKDEEDMHEDRVDTLEENLDKQIRTEENAFDDSIRAQEQAEDDRVKGQEDGLTERQRQEEEAFAAEFETRRQNLEDLRRLEDQSWSDRLEDERRRMGERHEAQRTGLDAEVEEERKGMEKRHEKRQDGLRDQQEAEDAAADARVESMKKKHPITMAQLQTEIDDQLAKRRQMNTDLETIAAEGGDAVNSTVLAKLAELGPDVVALVAGSGKDAIKDLATSINEGVEELDTSKITAGFDSYGKAAAKGTKQGFFGEMWSTLSHALFGVPQELLASLAASAGLDPKTGKPLPVFSLDTGGSGKYIFRGDIKTKADGGITRNAQISSTPILWAEAGPEAYIPLSHNRAGRSTSILAQAASNFGYGLVRMADGGIYRATGPGSGPGGIHVEMPIHVEARVEAGIDLGRAGRVIAEEVNRGVRVAFGELERQVTVKAWRG